MNELPLLEEYAASGSPEVFKALVDQYIDLVYTSARRQVRDPHLAEDVTQAVFIVLHQKARTIPRDRPLSAWLLKTTSYTAANARRLRVRRQNYERKAAEMVAENAHMPDDDAGWEELTPMLDAGLAKLKAADRNALLLKFFERKSLREIGQTLGVSEEAAAKRVTRAVDKLRDYFARHGATVSSAALGIHLTDHVIHSAPAGFSQAVAAGAASPGATAPGTLLAKHFITAMTIKKTAAVTGACILLLAGVGGAIVATKAMFTGPKAREVVIDLPTSKFTATFSDGTNIEAVGLSELPGAKNWWAPDGSKIDPPAGTPDLTGAAPNDASVRLFIVRFNFTGQDMQNKRLVAAFKSDKGCNQTWQRESNTNGQGICFVPLPADAKMDDLRLGVARGEYKTVATLNLHGPTSQPSAETPDGTFTKVVSVAYENGQTVVEVHHASKHVNRHNHDEQVVGMVGGRPTRPSSQSGLPNGHVRMTFRCRPNEISQIVYQARDFEWVQLTKVALAPNMKTDVQVLRPATKPTVAGASAAR
ncbi:MAG TPA: sigma-70 family RNA polymerase sigma factor [Tepidisphaeraceae bacterium]|jgi:RNA polymerase sigma factor (sigma-70 family)